MLTPESDPFAAVLERIHHVFLDDHATTHRNLPANDEYCALQETSVNVGVH